MEYEDYEEYQKKLDEWIKHSNNMFVVLIILLGYGASFWAMGYESMKTLFLILAWTSIFCQTFNFVLMPSFDFKKYWKKQSQAWDRLSRKMDREMNEIYKTLSRSTRAPIGCWTFNEGKGNIVHDSSGNKNHGELIR